MKLDKIVKLLDGELMPVEIPDASHNGLQVENGGDVKRVCCGVDASMELFEEAKKRGADMVICHHGLSWGDSLKRITELNYKRIKFLMDNDMALYACHLPLDAHPKYGNNILICKALGLQKIKKFGLHNGVELGFEGAFGKPIRYESFKNRVKRIMKGSDLRCMDFGKKTIRTVAVVSGGASDELGEAGGKGIDVYLSGEAKLSAYNVAREMEINAVFAGHYATEVFGVRAVAGLLKKKGVKAEFVELKVPF